MFCEEGEMLALDSTWVNSHEQPKMLAEKCWMELGSSDLIQQLQIPQMGGRSQAYLQNFDGNSAGTAKKTRTLWTSAVSPKMTRASHAVQNEVKDEHQWTQRTGVRQNFNNSIKVEI